MSNPYTPSVGDGGSGVYWGDYVTINQFAPPSLGLSSTIPGEAQLKGKMLDADLALRNRQAELDAEFKNATAQRKHEIELEKMRLKQQQTQLASEYNYSLGKIGAMQATGGQIERSIGELSGAQNQGNALYQQGYGDVRNQMDSNNSSYSEGKGYLTPAYARYQGLADNGMYTQGEYDSQLKSAYGDALNAATTQGANLNNSLASRGLGGNPYAAASMGLQGQFAAQGARGTARANLDREQAQSRVTGIGGMASTGGQLSALGQAYAAMNSGLAQGGAGLLADQAGFNAGIAGSKADYMSRPTQDNTLRLLSGGGAAIGNVPGGVVGGGGSKPPPMTTNKRPDYMTGTRYL